MLIFWEVEGNYWLIEIFLISDVGFFKKVEKGIMMLGNLKFKIILVLNCFRFMIDRLY